VVVPRIGVYSQGIKIEIAYNNEAGFT